MKKIEVKRKQKSVFCQAKMRNEVLMNKLHEMKVFQIKLYIFARTRRQTAHICLPGMLVTAHHTQRHEHTHTHTCVSFKKLKYKILFSLKWVWFVECECQWCTIAGEAVAYDCWIIYKAFLLSRVATTPPCTAFFSFFRLLIFFLCCVWASFRWLFL